MANSFFKFKQFIVHQENCAMKVCTDACLFGGWVAERMKNYELEIKNCLDIGTGTGLLSLMLAQQNQDIIIDAIEINEDAANQAKNNFLASLWNNRLNSIYADVNQYLFSKKYQLIISNPPFFENDLKSDNAKRNLALHSSQLRLDELLKVIKNNLSSDGKFAILLPYHRTDSFEELCSIHQFFLEEKVLVKQTPAHNYFRSMLLFSSSKTEKTEKEITVKTSEQQYSMEFITLLKEYYLYL